MNATQPFRRDPCANPASLAELANAPLDLCELIFLAADCDSDCVRILRGEGMAHIDVALRQAIVWIARIETTATFEQIGRTLKRDHSVAFRAFRRAQLRRGSDLDFRIDCDHLQSQFTGRVNLVQAA